MTPKKYRVTRRSQRYDAIKALNGKFSKLAPKIDPDQTLENFEKDSYCSSRSPWRWLCRSLPMQHGDSFMRGVHIPPYYPAIAEAAAEKARTAPLHDPIYTRGISVVVPLLRQVCSGQTASSGASGTGKKVTRTTPPQQRLPEEVVEAETGSSRDDPLVILLEREGAYHEAYELRPVAPCRHDADRAQILYGTAARQVSTNTARYGMGFRSATTTLLRYSPTFVLAA